MLNEQRFDRCTITSQNLCFGGPLCAVCGAPVEMHGVTNHINSYWNGQVEEIETVWASSVYLKNAAFWDVVFYGLNPRLSGRQQAIWKRVFASQPCFAGYTVCLRSASSRTMTVKR